ncbi:AAA family ATPase [Bacillus cereus group sp. Bc002]|uniref:AAA family ATPase n=1 Tax=Bacillus cereus group TaxID=86661 RepID=UPI0022E4557B|nr:AAA family ATPase [Bacillus cereus group sp. Bc002]MDA2780972.1 AAA family ATPase [Bacillus cereus group sp. Bc002]
MKIDKLTINAIGGIDQLELSFNPGMNLICGPNGVGKTTILECISHSFTGISSKILKRNSNYESGNWTITVSNHDHSEERTFTRTRFHPTDQIEYPGHTFQEHLLKILVFKSNRQLQHIEVEAIPKDPTQDEYQIANEMDSIGTTPDNIKSWFLSRFVWSAHKGLLNEAQTENLELAKRCFGIIDPNVSFNKVIPDTHEILLSAFGKDIYFEYLSSGYKSVLILLLGLIKQIEYRFKNPYLKVIDFDGLILIDEADLHLHPQWQARLIQVLKEVVPKAQIILSTHSPHMIQVAEPNELISLGLNEQSTVYRRDLPSSTFGYQGWTVEEILKDVMGLQETRSDTYMKAIKEFEDALDKEDAVSATKAYNTLDLMLHPRNPLKKILEMQLATLGGTIE